MKNSGFLGDLIASILDRGTIFSGVSDDREVEQLCSELLSSMGEVSSRRIGSAILTRYQQMDDASRLSFFQFLNSQMDIDVEAVETAARAYGEDRSAANLAALSDAAEAPRQELLRRLNHVPGATSALVEMRKELLNLLSTHPDLKRLDLDFSHLFTSWFNRGFLVIRPISWHSPANILAKIIQYEAVHAIQDWDDLRRRLQPDDRRCFAFFHPSMPDEPLVFVEVALCRGIPRSVQDVLRDERSELDRNDVDTAVFYSISNCQEGLRGISFGNFLIKQVVADLSVELPQLKTFVTLSPLPGLVRWLKGGDSPVSQEFVASLDDPQTLEANNDQLRSLAAKYLLTAKRQDGLPLDPVARFHLSNGAAVHELHALADISANGLKNAFGVMVNYLYDIPKVESQHEAFVHTGDVIASKSVAQLANAKIPAPMQRIVEKEES
ncbi:MAG: malonyl-CoA decarboxylase [Rhizobiaceae bacterium]|nr:malonyl-CoA decarboxylase [Hyphomicrobiales bacterium]NRB28961.1 malonyl-CoA decarboxylase [Rhizobiaceae bacterium]